MLEVAVSEDAALGGFEASVIGGFCFPLSCGWAPTWTSGSA
jgi:hypothetical protein